MTLADRLVVMHKGKIQQNASAQECFDRPANRFVAGFIGTPPMNIVDGHIEGADFIANGVRMPTGRLMAPRACALGVRPDRMRLVRPNSDHSIAATVAAVERLGDRTDIALDSAWGRLLARVNADDAAHVREADAVGVAFEPAHVHLFAPGECGARI